MELDLHSAPSGAPAVPERFSDRFYMSPLSWWFWIKAGMGLTLGAGIVSATAVVLWSMLIGLTLTGFLRGVPR